MANIIDTDCYLKNATLTITLNLPTDKTRPKTIAAWKNAFYYSYSSSPIIVQNTALELDDTNSINGSHIKIDPSLVTINTANSTATIKIRVSDIAKSAYDTYISLTPEAKDDRENSNVYISYTTKNIIAISTTQTKITLDDSDWEISDNTSSGDGLTMTLNINNFMQPSPKGDIPFWAYFNKLNSGKTNYKVSIYKDTITSVNNLVTCTFTFKEVQSKIAINTSTYKKNEKIKSVLITDVKINKKGFIFDIKLTNKYGTNGINDLNATTKLNLIIVVEDENKNSSTTSILVPVNVPSLFIRKEGVNINAYESSEIADKSVLLIDNPSNNVDIVDNIALLKSYSKNNTATAPSIGFYAGRNLNLYFRLYISTSEADAWIKKIDT